MYTGLGAQQEEQDREQEVGKKQKKQRSRSHGYAAHGIKEGSFGEYLYRKMIEADVTLEGFCKLGSHLYVEKFRNILRDKYEGDLPTWQLVQFADITRSDSIEMVFQYMKDQGYWKDRTEEEMRARAVTVYLLEMVPKLRIDQQESLYNMVKIMYKWKDTEPAKHAE